LGLFKRRIKKRSLNVTKALLEAATANNRSSAGVSITEERALKYSAVFGCVRVLAETVASLPLHVYRRLEGGGKERATDHYLYDLLHVLPNPELTSFEFRELQMVYLTLWGNAYAEIEFGKNGKPVALWPLRPDQMQVRRVDGELVYEYQSNAVGRVTFPWYKIFHIRGLSTDGVVGLSMIRIAREAIGLGLAAEEFGARFFDNDARPGIVLEHPGTLSEEALEHLRKSWEAKHKSLADKHRVAILEEGMKVHEVGIPPEDAQFLETRKFQVNEIARIFRVPPHLIGDLEKATFSNIEQQSIEFVIHTIRPWLVRWEQAIMRDLFSKNDRNEYFAEFLVDGLLRGDIESRYKAYAIGRQNGWLSADDIRELENMNPLPDGMGKIYLIPLNMVPAYTLSDKSNKKEEGKNINKREIRAAESRRRIANSFMPLYTATAQKIVKREVAELKKAIKKYLMRRDVQDFSDWMDEFYEKHKEYMNKTWFPVYLTYREAINSEIIDELNLKDTNIPDQLDFINRYLESHNNKHIYSSKGQLGKILRESEKPIEDIEKRLDEWEERRPNKIAKLETVQFSNAIARETYRSVGIQRLQWVASPKSCPYCNSLDGRIVGIDSTFLSQGISFQPDGVEEPMVINFDIFHPPAHEGCVCQIMAV